MNSIMTVENEDGKRVFVDGKMVEMVFFFLGVLFCDTSNFQVISQVIYYNNLLYILLSN